MILTLFDLFKIQLPCYTCGFESKLQIHLVKDNATVNFHSILDNSVLYLTLSRYESINQTFSIDIKTHEMYPKITNLNNEKINFSLMCLDCLTDFHAFGIVNDNILSALEITNYWLFYQKYNVVASLPMDQIDLKIFGKETSELKIPPFTLNNFINNEVESIIKTYEIFS